MTYRILVTGSRQWTDRDTILSALAQAVFDSIDEDQAPLLVHGACPQGADAIADELWTGEVERHPADWTRYGRAAGVIRNQEMVDLGASVVLAFPLPGGRGTQDCMARAEKAGLTVWEYAPEGGRVAQGS